MSIDFPLVGDTRPTTPTLTRILTAAPACAELSGQILNTRAWRTDYVEFLVAPRV